MTVPIDRAGGGSARRPGSAAPRPAGPILVHVKSPVGGEPALAELQGDRMEHRPNLRKVIYAGSRTAAWVAVGWILDLPAARP